MEERTMGINEARPVLGDLADDAARGIPTILTLHKRPLARIAPLEREEKPQMNDTFSIPAQLIGGDASACLLMEVHQDVTADAGIAAARIAPGDWVIVRQQPAAGDGKIAAVMRDGDAILTSAQPPDGAPVIGEVVSVIHRA
jgi:repressor LexA